MEDERAEQVAACGVGPIERSRVSEQSRGERPEVVVFEHQESPRGPGEVRAARENGAVRLGVLRLSESGSRSVEEMVTALGAATGTLSESAGVGEERFDAAIVNLSKRDVPRAGRALERIRTSDHDVAVVALGSRLTAADIVTLMRSGATDVVLLPVETGALCDRVVDAVARTRLDRHQSDRVKRLSRLCRQLTDERREVADQVEQLSAEVIGTYNEMEQRVGQANLAAQFGAFVSDELDVEELLRKTLEFVLDRVGITNSVVFLPSSSGDWSVGAYVNADMPEETFPMMLDQLADVLPPAFSGEEWLVRLSGREESEAALGESAAEWLGERTVLVMPCDHGGDRMGMLCVFREAEFGEPHVEDTRSIGEVFTHQLAKVVRIHNRTSHELTWFGFDVGGAQGDDEDDDGLDSGDWWKKAA